MRLDERGFVEIKFEGRIPRLYLNDRYEGLIKWIGRGIVAVGLISSVISIRQWYVSLAFAVALLLLEQFFERVIFRYNTMYVLPMPDFDLEPERWVGTAFLSKDDLFTSFAGVGLVFNSQEYGRKVFGLLRAWNDGERIDFEDNVKLSFVFTWDKEYITYVYPSYEKKSIQRAKERLEEDLGKDKAGKEHDMLIMQIALGKKMNIVSEPNVLSFTKATKQGDKFFLAPVFVDSTGNYQLDKEFGIEKFHYRTVNQNKLTETDPEFHFISSKKALKEGR